MYLTEKREMAPLIRIQSDTEGDFEYYISKDIKHVDSNNLYKETEGKKAKSILYSVVIL